MSFTGKAVHDSGAFDELWEDISDIIGMISPDETPLLNILGNPQRAATNVYHEWLEDSLQPTTVVMSSAVASTAADTSMGVASNAGRFQTGMILYNDTTQEYSRISAISGNTFTVTRAFGPSSASSLAAGSTWQVISNAALEGADVSEDTSNTRSRNGNYSQIFKADMIISGTEQAISHIGVSNEMEYQKAKRAREVLRQLERAAIQGILSNNSIGSASATRTMKGLLAHLTTNVYTVSTLTESHLANVVELAWNAGAQDLDTIVVDQNYKRIIDSWNATRVRVDNAESLHRNKVTLYENTYGMFNVVLNRWMPANTGVVIAASRVKVVPLQKRSFAYKEIGVTGDSTKGMILGEYSMEVKNEDGMARFANSPQSF